MPDETGQGIVEYGLVIGLMFVTVILVFVMLSDFFGQYRDINPDEQQAEAEHRLDGVLDNDG